MKLDTRRAPHQLLPFHPLHDRTYVCRTTPYYTTHLSAPVSQGLTTEVG